MGIESCDVQGHLIHSHSPSHGLDLGEFILLFAVLHNDLEHVEGEGEHGEDDDGPDEALENNIHWHPVDCLLVLLVDCLDLFVLVELCLFAGGLQHPLVLLIVPEKGMI